MDHIQSIMDQVIPNRKQGVPETGQPPHWRAESALCDLASRLKRARKRRGWSQAHTAQLLQIGLVTYGRMERGDSGIAIGTWMSVFALLGRLDEVRNLLLYDRDSQGAALEQSLRAHRKSKQSLEDLADRL